MTCNVIIRYTNGSMSVHPFPTFERARYFYRNNISYSGNRVQRVEAQQQSDLSVRAVWDADWNDESKYAGLS